jgi:hypothetical protein
VDRAKIKAIEQLPPPVNVKGIRSILGHGEFYCHFIKVFLQIARPLTNLLAKDAPFEFTDECSKALYILKEALISAPIIQTPYWSLPFEIMCDPSDYTIGAVLDKTKDKKHHVSVFYQLPTEGYTRGGKFRLGDAEIRNSKVQGTQGLDRFGPRCA